ncbi:MULTISPECIES: hypothetical protein [unclassified Caulobacter]|uniref:hypothetical protein n=1 Tax=unclassified Caulobacter TaxID=2648921 RepID=UPI0006FFB601|nr:MULTISPECIES: hypothetical protein [unclassified Caulobacter]KQV62796.1 hypothetical protein ASC62_04490 [Caulobacter sp. Root342]KQV71929.1 hypothetical protein ASC70_23765 [Caulobacter sp. Root343]
MMKAMMAAAIGQLEKRYDYDASYVRDLLDASPKALKAFQGVQTLASFREGAPAAAIAAAGLVATLTEDCGPCVQIGVKIAEENHVPADVLRGILTGDHALMGPDASLAWRFARASLDRDLETADPLRDAVLERWGTKGLAAIALAIASSRVYPTIKYAMGHGKACSRVNVGGEAVAVRA